MGFLCFFSLIQHLGVAKSVGVKCTYTVFSVWSLVGSKPKQKDNGRPEDTLGILTYYDVDGYKQEHYFFK